MSIFGPKPLVTEAELRQMMPNAGDRLTPHLPFIEPAMEWGKINTPWRAAAFLAQLAHESGEYRYMREIASGAEYEGRTDLGDIYPGDGVKFAGEGPMQITGRDNITACGKALGIDAATDPTLLQKPENATRSAVWFWNSRSLSLVADQSWFRVITRVINGGYNGWDSRLAYYARNRGILGLPPYHVEGEAESIMKFQHDHGLVPVDGIVGPKTMRALANV